MLASKPGCRGVFCEERTWEHNRPEGGSAMLIKIDSYISQCKCVNCFKPRLWSLPAGFGFQLAYWNFALEVLPTKKEQGHGSD